SAVLSGMRLSTELMPMMGQDISTPRKLGAFVMALNPAAFGSRDEFDAGMIRYLNALRRSETREGGTVLAPGDREWALADNRHSHGVPLDPATIEAFTRLARTHGLPPLDPIRATTR
ncbi:MAG: Ldh family oxidoreductase, partial [Pseudomonadota bacterium]